MASTITDLSDFFDNVPSIQDPDNFEAYATENLVDQQNLFGTGGEIHDFITETNALALEVETNTTTAENSATVSSAAANFKGNWSDLTGAATIPYSVYHSLQFWVLNTNLADVTAKEPGVDVEWTQSGNAKSGVNSDITSMTGLDGSDLDISGGYLVDAQNIPDMLAGRGPGYWFDGVDDVITVADNAAIDIGTGDFSFEFNFICNSLATSVIPYAHIADASNYVLAILLPAGYMRIESIIGGVASGQYNSDSIFEVGKHYNIAFTSDRDGTKGQIYLNGKPITTTEATAMSAASLDVAGNLFIGSDSLSTFSSFSPSMLRQFNLALTPAEVKAFSNGAPIPYKYIGGGVKYTSDFSAGVDDWVSNAGGTLVLSGNETIAAITETLKLTATADVALSMYAGISIPMNKQIRVDFDYYADASCGVAYIGWGNDGNNQVNGNNAPVVEGSWQTDSILVDVEHGSRTFCGYTTETGSTGDQLLNGKSFYFKNVKITQIGCVLDLSPSGITTTEWIDQSGNDRHGTVSGAIATGLPRNVLAFPATAVLSSDPNTLDDYEEGTWTPVLYRDGTTNIAYTSQIGKYIKIGKQVTLSFKLVVSGITTQGAGYNAIAGNPFTPDAEYFYCGSALNFSAISASNIIGFTSSTTYIFPNTSTGANPNEDFAVGTLSGNIIIFV